MSDDDNNNEHKWYANDKILLGWAIIFFPIAVYGIWQRKDYDKETRWIYSGITIVVAMSLLGVDSLSRHAIFFLAAPVYAWFIWKDVVVDKAFKIPLMVGAVLLVLSGFSELASGPRPKPCPRTETTASGYTYVVGCDGKTIGGVR